MAQQIGPRTSDATFFTTLIDTTLPGLTDIPALAEKGDYKEARKVFAAYIRANIKPDYFIKQPFHAYQSTVMRDGETWKEAADRICTNLLISCATEHQFGETVDYFVNPTFNQYKEWTWQLSRHSEWRILGYAYLQTGDEKYARSFAEQFDTWVKQAVSPEPKTQDGGATLCWRSIETGIRMGSTWQYTLSAFHKSPAFTDDLITDWHKSVHEHGQRLEHDYKRVNWLLMEMDGLAQIGILYPVLKDAGRWYDFAIKMLDRQLELQFYADGFQFELTTGYHGVSVGCYIRLMRVAKAYGYEMPEGFLKKLENAVGFYPKLIMPDFILPDINDGGWGKVDSIIAQYMDFFPHREDFVWASAKGEKGAPPDYVSVALPYSGFIAMRTSWDADAVYGLLDAAPWGCAHQHEDKLSMIMYMNGRRVLTEGGNYAYDDSEMRRYVLSTRSHNTVRVNGCDQNRRKNYKWDDDDIYKESGMAYAITDAYDYASGVYDEGYGPEAQRMATHERSVILVKKPEFTDKPFFIVIDRLRSQNKNRYESLWHMNVDGLLLNGLDASANEVCVLVSGADGMSSEIVKGQEEPEWQGWVAKVALQGEYVPVPTLRYTWDAADSRVVTVFFPSSAEGCGITGVKASQNIDDTDIIIYTRGGKTVAVDEKDYR